MLTARLRRSAPPGRGRAGQPHEDAVPGLALPAGPVCRSTWPPRAVTRSRIPDRPAPSRPLAPRVIGDFELDVVDGGTGTDAGPAGVGVTDHVGHRLPQGQGEGGLVLSRKYRQINSRVGVDSCSRQRPLRVDQLGAESFARYPATAVRTSSSALRAVCSTSRIS